MVQSYILLAALTFSVSGEQAAAVRRQDFDKPTRVPIHVNTKYMRILDQRAFLLGSLPGEEGPGTGGMEIIDLKNGRTLKSLKVPSAAVRFDVLGDLLYFAMKKRGVRIMNWRTGEDLGSLANAGEVWSVYLYRHYICLYAASKLSIVDLKSGKTIAKHDLKGVGRGLQIVGRTLYYAHQYPGGIQIIDVPTGKITTEIDCGEWLASIRIVGKLAYCQSSFKHDFLVFDLETKKLVGRIDVPRQSEFSSRWAVSPGPEGIAVLDLATKKVVRKLDARGVRIVQAEGDSVLVVTGRDLLLFRAGAPSYR